MPTIPEMLQNLRSLQLRSQLPIFVEQTKYEIIRLNTQEQLNRGLLSTGSKIEPKYSSIPYALDKERQNPNPGFLTPDLFVTGGFYSGWYVTVDTQQYKIGSNDTKATELEAKYTNFVYGLTSENKSLYSTTVLYAKFKEYIEAKTGLLLR